jgi:hypothetical protein
LKKDYALTEDTMVQETYRFSVLFLKLTAEWEWDCKIRFFGLYIGSNGVILYCFGAHTGIGNMPITLYGTRTKTKMCLN